MQFISSLYTRCVHGHCCTIGCLPGDWVILFALQHGHLKGMQGFGTADCTCCRLVMGLHCTCTWGRTVKDKHGLCSKLVLR